LNKEIKIFTGIIIVIIVVVATSLWFAYLVSRDKTTITVDRMWIKSVGEGSQKYLVSDTDGVVYEITDSLPLLQFDASNRWAKINVGKTYEIVTYGWRNYFLSWYKNIVKFTEISTKD
jgi:hypothetical protein